MSKITAHIQNEFVLPYTMSFYLVSIFYKNPDHLKEFQTFREKRLDLVRNHGGTIVTLFQPAGHTDSDVPDEIHVCEFPSRDDCRGFQADAARRSMAELGSQVLFRSNEYTSETLIPTESVFATVISRRPDFLQPSEPETVSLAEQLTMNLSRLPSTGLHPAQRQAELDTVILHPQSPTQKKLSTLVQKWQAAHDRRVIFAHTYYLMTTNMLSALKGEQFHDPDWVTRLLDRFAVYYFDALDKYEKAPHNSPSIWRVAFEVAENPEAFVVQHLLLGVNAHINFDLSSSLIDVMREEWSSLDAGKKRQRYEDHTRVNKIIATTFDDAQELVIARYSPSLDRLMQASWAFDELMVSSLINAWREQAWQQAAEYLDAKSWEARHAARQRCEYIALRRADMIMLRQGPVKMKLLF